MNDCITAADIHRAFLQTGRERCPKAIKVTNEFLQYLEAECRTEVVLVNSAQGLAEAFMGVPVFVDNTIDNPYYEFVF
jgi:hypothetical protein